MTDTLEAKLRAIQDEAKKAGTFVQYAAAGEKMIRLIPVLLAALREAGTGYARPTGWIKGHTTHTPDGHEYDEECVPGCDPPVGDGWLPLFKEPEPVIVVGGRRSGKTYMLNLELDAARFRWLRDHSAGQWTHPIVCNQVRKPDGMLYVGPVIGVALDQAIDAAIVKERANHG
ncbi:hypothetical protein [Dyella sp.]|uniref:hypothetical protein n=1 Tax=Dyella sp. TaxID=1869338 RepID=UPI002FD9DB9B